MNKHLFFFATKFFTPRATGSRTSAFDLFGPPIILRIDHQERSFSFFSPFFFSTSFTESGLGASHRPLSPCVYTLAVICIRVGGGLLLHAYNGGISSRQTCVVHPDIGRIPEFSSGLADCRLSLRLKKIVWRQKIPA